MQGLNYVAMHFGLLNSMSPTQLPVSTKPLLEVICVHRHIVGVQLRGERSYSHANRHPPPLSPLFLIVLSVDGLQVIELRFSSYRDLN